MGEADIARVFTELLIFEDTFSLNKDWINAQSRNEYPSFISFELKKKDKIFLRVTTAD